jgi:hypothetical protein
MTCQNLWEGRERKGGGRVRETAALEMNLVVLETLCGEETLLRTLSVTSPTGGE